MCISLILAERFQLDDAQIEQVLRNISNPDELESKLRLLDSYNLLADISLTEENDILSSPIFYCTYDELIFAIQVPEMMQFSESQKQEYNKRVLFWSRYTDMRNTVLPVLEKLCDKEAAAEILKNLYISSYTTVCEESIIEICERFLNFPDASDLLASYLAENWYLVFSVYSDPLSALQMLDDVFLHEHVLEVFTDSIDWNRIGYLKNEPVMIQQMLEAWSSEIWKDAKEKFSNYLKK